MTNLVTTTVLPEVIREAEIAADNMFQQTSRWLFGELQHHLALHRK